MGGLLFAVGIVVLLIRKSGQHEWSSGGRTAVLSAVAVGLYVLALEGEWQSSDDDAARPWQSVLMVTSLLLWPLALFELLGWVGANTENSLYAAAVFAITSLLAGLGARRARTSSAALIAGLSLLLTWSLLWSSILGHPSANTIRWLLVVGALLLFAVADRLRRDDAIGAAEVASAGGIAAVAAGVLGVIIGTFSPVVDAFNGIGEQSSNAFVSHVPLGPERFAATVGGGQHLGWDVYLLFVSLALTWIGSRGRIRGLGYIGAFGLLAFIDSVGEQIARIDTGRLPTHHAIAGWPLVLLILGVAGLLAPLLAGPKPSPSPPSPSPPSPRPPSPPQP